MSVEILSFMPFLLIFFVKKEYSRRSFFLRLFIPVSYLVLWLSSFFVEAFDANKMLASLLSQTIYFIAFSLSLLFLRSEYKQCQNKTRMNETVVIVTFSFLITLIFVGFFTMLVIPFAEVIMIHIPELFRKSFAFSFGLQLSFTFINMFCLELKECGFKWRHPKKNAKIFAAVIQDFKTTMFYDGSKVKISKLIAFWIVVLLYVLILALLAISLYII